MKRDEMKKEIVNGTRPFGTENDLLNESQTKGVILYDPQNPKKKWRDRDRRSCHELYMIEKSFINNLLSYFHSHGTQIPVTRDSPS